MSTPGLFAPGFSKLLSSIYLTTLILALASFTTNCGSGGSGGSTMPANTQITVALTSTGNDQLVYFDMVLNTITLTEKSGNTATLIPAPQGFEFIQRNGQLAPGFTTTVQQGTYVSATATVGAAEFNCVADIPNQGLTASTYAYGYTPDSHVTVNVPAPIAISGSSTMGLLINLDVLQSATFPSDCWEQGATWSITPTFTITPFDVSQAPASPQNGKVLGLIGEISAIGTAGTGFTLAAAEASAPPDNVTINTSSNTVYQGIGNFSGLTVGTFVDMDGALQEDSSVLALRIAVEYPSAVDTVTGPVIFVSDAERAIYIEGYNQQGSDYANAYFLDSQPFSFDNAVFQISGELTNLEDLPFVATFTGSNMVAGQNLYVSSPQLTDQSNPYTELDAITLIPQTINGTVTGSAPSGTFTVYSVSLAPYDLFPNLAVQPGQATLLNNPSDVEVYVDNNTQLLNQQPLSGGGTFRFYGLVFNDNGTLRMDCAQVNDGVAFSAPPTAAQQKFVHTGTVQQIRRELPGGMHETINVIKQQP